MQPMNPLNYPLEQLMTIKQNRFEQAQKTLEEKKEILAQEERKLKKLEDERDEVLKHKQAKLDQLRAALDKGERTDKLQQMKVYLKVVEENLQIKKRSSRKPKEKCFRGRKTSRTCKARSF